MVSGGPGHYSEAPPTNRHGVGQVEQSLASHGPLFIAPVFGLGRLILS